MYFQMCAFSCSVRSSLNKEVCDIFHASLPAELRNRNPCFSRLSLPFRSGDTCSKCNANLTAWKPMIMHPVFAELYPWLRDCVVFLSWFVQILKHKETIAFASRFLSENFSATHFRHPINSFRRPCFLVRFCSALLILQLKTTHWRQLQSSGHSKKLTHMHWLSVLPALTKTRPMHFLETSILRQKMSCGVMPCIFSAIKSCPSLKDELVPGLVCSEWESQVGGSNLAPDSLESQEWSPSLSSHGKSSKQHCPRRSMSSAEWVIFPCNCSTRKPIPKVQVFNHPLKSILTCFRPWCISSEINVHQLVFGEADTDVLSTLSPAWHTQWHAGQEPGHREFFRYAPVEHVWLSVKVHFHKYLILTFM